MKSLTLLTDLYQLTMMGGYHGHEKLSQRSCFELYFRKLPFGGGYCVAAGLEPALDYITGLWFGPEQLAHLRSLSLFSEEFLKWLSEFRFQGDIWAMQEGELVFPGEPLLRLEANLPEAQLVESALLNILNFQTLVATKAARVCSAAQGGAVLEFGLRRAQGIDGALSATRAAYLGGCHATSNVLAGQLYGIPVRGTHAHSWIMSFATELEAFRAYADTYPESCTLLVDTYDTLESGVPNAIVVARELAQKGRHLAGIRLDSGDLCALSIAARRMLDEAGLQNTRIVASNDLDEYSISRLKREGARIDIWGVGTNLVTCKDDPALGGVYKLVAAENAEGRMEPRIKLSSNPVKSTLPGAKMVYRAYDEEGRMLGDVLALAEEKPSLGPSSIRTTHPQDFSRSRSLEYSRLRPLLAQVMKNGECISDKESLESLESKRHRAIEALATLGQEYKELCEPSSYWIGISDGLLELRNSMDDLGETPASPSPKSVESSFQCQPKV